MNKLVTISILSKTRRSEPVSHTLTVSIHDQIVKKTSRLVSHCRSVARKSYGNSVDIVRIVDFENNVLWELDNEKRT